MEINGNNLMERDPETGALMQVQALKEEAGEKVVNGNRLFIRDNETKALMPVVKVKGLDGGSGGGTAPPAGGDNGIYSLEETDTGKKWIDGKPIYRRVFSGVFAAAKGKELDRYTLGKVAVDKIIDVGGFWTADTGGLIANVGMSSLNLYLKNQVSEIDSIMLSGIYALNGYLVLVSCYNSPRTSTAKLKFEVFVEYTKI